MRHLWLFWFPLLFLPNLGFRQATGFGTLEFSDFLIVPYVGLVLLATTWRTKLAVGRLTPWLGLFIVWALVSTLTISVRYGYADDFHVTFGLLKIAKMVLYGVAGILTARALAREDVRPAFDWSLLGAAVVTGVSLWLTQVGPAQQSVSEMDVITPAEAKTGYVTVNAVSVMAAILSVYLAGRWLSGGGSRRWRLAAPIGLLVILAGMTVSDGRGGWLAAIAGAVYLVLRVRFDWRLVAMLLASLVVIASLYQSQPRFREEVDKTVFLPTEEYGYQGTRTVGTVDDGGRFKNWTTQARKFDNAPLLGTGVWHRGGPTELWTTGSHNHWLQMFLELGAIGGSLAISVLVVMWRQATALRAKGRLADVPLKAALVVAIVGGLSETYFYGGIVLFTLFAVYAPTGGTPAGEVLRRAGRTTRARWQPQVPGQGAAQTSLRGSAK